MGKAGEAWRRMRVGAGSGESAEKEQSDVMINNFLARMRLSLASLMAHAVDMAVLSLPLRQLHQLVKNSE